MLNIKNKDEIKHLFRPSIWKKIEANKSIQIYATDDGYAWINFKEMGANGYRRFKDRLSMVTDINRELH